jgi:SAM-dependent methyltransferase
LVEEDVGMGQLSAGANDGWAPDGGAGSRRAGHREMGRDMGGRAAGGGRARSEPPMLRPYEADVVGGLADFARDEAARLPGGARLYADRADEAVSTAIPFDYGGDPRALLNLRTVLSVALVAHFAVPRPRALLGDEHLRRLLGLIEAVRALHPPAAFGSLALNAAGADSAVMTRLKAELAARAGLRPAEREGDLLLRLRRPPDGDEGWEALIRLSPRPLATRPWRVCNLPGALNATVAAVMARLAEPRPANRVLNLGCGSGTLLIERLSDRPARRAYGCDTDPAALDCARANAAAAGLTGAIELHPWDARALPLPAASVDEICADLPFGHRVGSHQANVALYPALLREAARVARPGARCVLISHEARLMERLLAESAEWETEFVRRLALETLRPRVFVLSRR